MRKIILFMVTSIDGYFEGENHDISWHHVDAEFNEFAIEHTNSFSTLIFGRKTYELMASYWPTPAAINDDPIVANLMNSKPKIVVSTTLQAAEWNNTRLIKENVQEELTKLKAEASSDIAVYGSNNLCVRLIEMGLLDEVRVMVNPVALGTGTSLCAGLKNKLEMTLISTRVFKNGNVLLYYAIKK